MKCSLGISNVLKRSLIFPIILLSSFFALIHSIQFSSVTQSYPTLRPHEPRHSRPPCPSPTPGVYPNSCLLSWWCHPAISSSVIFFSSYPQSFQASGSFQMRQLFVSGGQSIGVSASTSVLPMNTQGWSPLEWTNNRLVPNRKRSSSRLFIVTLLI